MKDSTKTFLVIIAAFFAICLFTDLDEEIRERINGLQMNGMKKSEFEIPEEIKETEPVILKLNITTTVNSYDPVSQASLARINLWDIQTGSGLIVGRVKNNETVTVVSAISGCDRVMIKTSEDKLGWLHNQWLECFREKPLGQYFEN